MNLAKKCSFCESPSKICRSEKKVLKWGGGSGIKLYSSKKNIFAAYFGKITGCMFLWLPTSSGKVDHIAILHIFAFYISDLSSTAQLQSRVFCRCRFRKFRKRAKNAFFAVFSQKRLMKFHTEQFVVNVIIAYSILHI